MVFQPPLYMNTQLKNYEFIRANLRQAKVLIIEDNLDHWVLMKKALQHCLPEVTHIRVDTPDQALELLNEWRHQEWEIPKLIILDLYLPDRMDGWKLLQQIKAMPASCSQIPVVMLSSSDVRNDISEAYDRGAASYLVKPTDLMGWIAFFQELRTYWWETVTLPPLQFSV